VECARASCKAVLTLWCVECGERSCVCPFIYYCFTCVSLMCTISTTTAVRGVCVRGVCGSLLTFVAVALTCDALSFHFHHCYLLLCVEWAMPVADAGVCNASVHFKFAVHTH
jgi:hypothetical protein